MRLVRYVHVIMPVGSDPLSTEKKLALNTGITSSGREARFPIDLSSRPPFELARLVEEIRQADSVIADLSHERPSCYYELGVVEAMGKAVHLIAQLGTPIHQCADRHAVRYYQNMIDLTSIVERVLKE